MMIRTIGFLGAFLLAGCGKSACDEYADCLGVDADTLEESDEDACQALLDAAEEAGTCK